jgi:PAS domain S-box-containing protein
MSDFVGVDVERVASGLLRGMPDVGLIVFTAELRVAVAAGLVPTSEGVRATEVSGRHVSEVLAPEHLQTCEPLFRAALAGRSGSVEMEVGDRWYRVGVEPLPHSEGAVAAGVCLWRDVTERRELVDELAQRARLIDLAHDAIIVREPATSAVTYWNREAGEIYGYSGEQARGRITHDLLGTEFPVSREEVDRALFDDGRWEGELWHTRADGRRILVASRQALVRDERGEPLAVIELNADITERKRAEREMRVAGERFRGLIESAPDAMVLVDPDGRIELVNARAEELFGYARSELIGHSVEMLLPAGLRSQHVGHRDAFVAGPRARAMGAEMDLVARRKDGSQFAADISLSPLQTESGLLVSAAIRDVSQQLLRQLEQALVPRMKIGARWQLAWRYLPAVRAMLLGGDFIGACERPDGSLALVIGDVAGHGVVAAGTGAMLRAAWLGAALSDVPLESLAPLLHRLLINQADHGASTMATACLAEVDPTARELRLVRAGHDSPLLIAPGTVTEPSIEHGPALGLPGEFDWPLERIQLPNRAAIMLYTDGLTERRAMPRSIRRFVAVAPHIEPDSLLVKPTARAIDDLLEKIFPYGTDLLEDDVAVILLNLAGTALEHDGYRTRDLIA